MCVAVLMMASCGGPKTPPKVEYLLEKDPASTTFPRRLSANVDREKVVIVPESEERCMAIQEQRDFDGNGTIDALITQVTACGGNCCPDSFFFVSQNLDGKFVVSEKFAESWTGAVVEEWQGKLTVKSTFTNEGMNTSRPIRRTTRYILNQNKAEQVSSEEAKEIPAVAEIRSEQFQSETDKPAFSFDLDGDGKTDKFVTSLWARWGRMYWGVEFASGKQVSETTVNCKRLGVLASKTNGINDLVCDIDQVLKWNGKDAWAAASGK